ncbi:similar to Saccharomyces cerevisiae YHR150W PEX28 Peroxisomal integral membrane peroxin, involved in the regulation of peroxisomal size, number and distribution [Maudiozyma saulgeensis]|uniref:Similar to Saccharomyces cerevisiae YHR150W PEX28 Peroxisomal integral membrane peroxin, involved in the regulation of peroxisomal size, number and distribution n=1 Tax=Maudiozyma saulgeensis TaxID=1789683 RepID=A0A1X7R687_9SACH|nr:similar to Saccharomyces cerevisiae YHR150W PEX28 Peroxisomal integral membrane peroxin, involved in the regulation of peroxisomal size, number and distribution [Kazachstania saulgeensis]
MKEYFRLKYIELLDSMLNAEELLAAFNDIDSTNEEISMVEENESASNKSVWNKELLTKMASSLVNVSLTKLKNKQQQLDGKNKDGDDTKTDFVAMEELQKYIDKTTDMKPTVEDEEPFLALFLDKLISRLVPEPLPAREHILPDVVDQEVSVAILASNVHKLSERMENVFEFQDTMVRILTWRQPSTMIIILLILTKICYNPMYLILLPLLYLSLGIIIKQYNLKYFDGTHSRQSHREKIGKSLINDLFKHEPSSYTTATTTNSLNTTPQEITHGMQVVLNLRDFQNLTTSQLHMMDSLSSFLNETAAFKDERITTLLLVGLLLSCIAFKCLSPFINWSLLCSCTLWLTAIITHPKLLPRLKQLHWFQSHDKQEISTTTLTTSTIKYDVILDQPPSIRYVEIFEIYRQGLIPTTWKFFIYSKSLFNPTDEYRRAQTPPPGVKDLSQVQAPDQWLFDPNSEWEIDYNIHDWASDRNLDLSVDNEFLIDSTFKRRRLTRRVIKVLPSS